MSIVLVVSLILLQSTAEAAMSERTYPLTRIFSSQRMGMERRRNADKLRHSRIMQKASTEGIPSFTLGGTVDLNMAGLYYTTIQLGSPPRELNVMIDTGSDVLWVTCNPCMDCPRSSHMVNLHLFDPAKSHSASLTTCSDAVCNSVGDCDAHNNQCAFTVKYSDGGGASGYFLTDLLHLDEILQNSTIKRNSTPVVFACSTHLSGILTHESRALDGILGLGHLHISVLSQLSSQGIIPNVFSHCLKGDGGGILVLGEILDDNIVHSPLDLSQNHYGLYLESISVNDQPLPIKKEKSHKRSALVDSGTLLVYLVDEAYESLISMITAAISDHAKPVILETFQCYELTESVISMFPRVSFHFSGNASIILRPEDYLMVMDNGAIDGIMARCIGFQRASAINQHRTVLGEIALINKIVVYDVAHRKLGWTEFDCDKPINVSREYGKDYYRSGARLKNVSANFSCFIIMIFLLYLILS